MSEIPGECPGLLSPTEMAEWKISMNFADQTISVDNGTPTAMSFTKTGHPIIELTGKSNTTCVYQSDVAQLASDESAAETISSEDEVQVKRSSKAYLYLEEEASSPSETDHAWQTDEEPSDGETSESSSAEQQIYHSPRSRRSC